jgi:hypothetical protein
MSSARKTGDGAPEAPTLPADPTDLAGPAEPAQPAEPDPQAVHAANAQWLKDNPDAMPQVSAGRWAVYDRAGHLRGHLVGDGPTRDTRFKATASERPPAADVLDGDVPDGYGITLHDAGAHLLDAAVGGDLPGKA